MPIELHNAGVAGTHLRLWLMGHVLEGGLVREVCSETTVAVEMLVRPMITVMTAVRWVHLIAIAGSHARHARHRCVGHHGVPSHVRRHAHIDARASHAVHRLSGRLHREWYGRVLRLRWHRSSEMSVADTLLGTRKGSVEDTN